MAPETGRYTITNVKFRNLVVLPDANDDSDLVARNEENVDAERWNITLLNNKRYTIKSHGFANFAGCDTRAGPGDGLRGRQRNQQWIIKETRIKGQFNISPTDADVFWGLADGEYDTPVTLASAPNDPKNQWIFTKV
ncbi:hypothetical protein GGX14DRAFT_664430 [Mycena pura]|uniref:Ricin B lectin domain-containing protein n=1 Tax=Mycena pura TaxID=153505 RepID=A0AAD7E0I3_9AGAR|nr:hypothetical protein GGX14DRAFT_664430 [Mycena pura]